MLTSKLTSRANKIRSTSTFLVALILLSSSGRIARAGFVETYALRLSDGTPMIPYSSSYLSRPVGDLVATVASIASPQAGLPDLLSPKVKSDAINTSVFGRFVRMRSEILSKTPESLVDPITHQPLYHLLKPDHSKSSWEGYCNQWTAASLDPTIAEALSQTDGLQCNDTFLTKPEIEELLTATAGIMDPSDSATDAAGQAVSQLEIMFGATLPDSNSPRTWVHDRLGISPTDAADFDSFVVDRLSHNQGVIINKVPGPEVWNQPVYEASFDRTELTLLSALPLLGKFPSDVLAGSDDTTKKLLKDLKRLSNQIYKAGEESPANPVVGMTQEQIKAIRADQKKSRDDIDKMLADRDVLLGQVSQAIQSQKIGLKVQSKIQSVVARLTFATESTFRQGKDSSDTVTFSYLLMIDPNGQKHGRWLSDERNETRPGYVGNTLRLSDLDPAAVKNSPLGDVLALLSSPRCKSMQSSRSSAGRGLELTVH